MIESNASRDDGIGRCREVRCWPKMRPEEAASLDGAADGGRPIGSRLPSRDFAPAFSLVELVVGMVVVGIMAAVTVHSLVSTAQVYGLLRDRGQADGELMDAVDRMRREMRSAATILAATNTTWSFINAQGQTNTFSFSGQAVRLNGAPLAQGVKSFEFKYYNASNDVLSPVTDTAAIKRVALALEVTNGLAASEAKVNFFLRKGCIK